MNDSIIPADEKRPTAVSKRHYSATHNNNGGDKRVRGLPWLDVFTKGLMSAHRPERCLPFQMLTTNATVYSGAERKLG
ncbi:hypothetical protein TNCV_502101 [Trichonephila clavipes]|nr:hypothetical protein TNCV_502101 [Trichonephila clavipes]